MRRGKSSSEEINQNKDVVRLTTVLKECVIGHVIRSAVALTVRGRGVQGFVVPGAGYRGKHVRCAFSDILDAGERRVQAGGMRREAAIPECKLTCFILVSSEI